MPGKANQDTRTFRSSVLITLKFLNVEQRAAILSQQSQEIGVEHALSKQPQNNWDRFAAARLNS